MMCLEWVLLLTYLCMCFLGTCSSEESAKAKTQKELLKTLKELKLHLPPEKRNKGSKSTTLNTLKYALRCVRQVEANEEYYQLLMINDSQPSGLDVSSYTIEEIDRITSEYTLKNTDIFAVAVSLITGKIVYISDQAASILNCKQDVFKNAKFVEFLTPQDVSVFYSFTTPYRLPSWSMCTGAESSPSDCMQEKSFFCRISGGKECEGDRQYYPFRMTPYLMKVQDMEHSEDQFCCLLLAERVHSGYEAPRIPTDKRIFTTTHTPSCVFQDVDERAVPLLGYLPQDLIGTPVLLHLHPSDRPVMLGIHRKILQYAGQPFDHSIRFCARNGEYITIDTSWSSFVNPWSRKVSFIIGRHKVRMGPVNEDVFAAPAAAEGKSVDSDIQEITEQIHRLLLQPVHNNGSSGYGSLGSNDHLLSVASSSESNGNGTRLFFSAEFLQKSPMVRPKDSAYPVNVRESPVEQRAGLQEELAFKDQTVYSYQQISCLDSVIRYLESCNVPITVKRKCQSSSNTTSSNSDEDKQRGNQPGLSSLEVPKKPPGSGVVSPSLTPLALPSKPESVVSITSQCSYSSTIVHVGDKKGKMIFMINDSGLTVPPAAVSPHNQEREAYKKLGLTKQVLAAHTQKEEQAFLSRFRELRGVHAFKADCSLYLERQKGQVTSEAVPAARSKQGGGGAPETSGTRRGRNKKTKSKRIKPNESSDSTPSGRRPPPRPQLQGLNQTSWSPSDTSQSTFPIAYPAVMPGYPLQMYPNNSSNYFGSVDSSQKSHKAKQQVSGSGSGALALDGSETLIKYALQDPLWLLMANVDEDVMMPYQLPSRDIQKVLREDREKLRQMQKSQPRFTEEQKRELAEVHPWMRRGGLPKAIDIKVLKWVANSMQTNISVYLQACVGCEEVSETLTEEDPPDLHMGETESSDVTVPPANSSEDSTHSETHACPGPVT
uniref:Period circadian protein homolog 2 n=1 Tax=Sinocyclocheilus rhinocerous TaxID=307959 RepID=A0A673HCD3_9TELE